MHLHIPPDFDLAPLVEALSRCAREQGYLLKGQIDAGQAAVAFLPAARGHAYVDLLGQTRYAEPDLQPPPRSAAHPNVLRFPRLPARTPAPLHSGPCAA